MFFSQDAKSISTQITKFVTPIRSSIKLAVEQSVLGRDEVPFIVELTNRLPSALDASLSAAGITSVTKATKIHQKPKVTYRNRVGDTVACELGDLLYVVKYLVPGQTEAKSVIHQMKSSGIGDTECHIDEVQLELLRDWPDFSFGRKSDGGAQTYKVAPWTLEFGTYTLMRRKPTHEQYVGAMKRDYGVSPSAWRVEDSGPTQVNMASIPFTLEVSNAIFNHVAFVLGESHAHGQVQALVDALYRYVGWAPDPPDEFDGYTNDYAQKPDAGVFAIIETQIAPLIPEGGSQHSKSRPPSHSPKRRSGKTP